MHNKLFIADGAMAVAGGRNIGDEYFMVSEGANYIDLDVFAIGPVVAQLAGLSRRLLEQPARLPARDDRRDGPVARRAAAELRGEDARLDRAAADTARRPTTSSASSASPKSCGAAASSCSGPRPRHSAESPDKVVGHEPHGIAGRGPGGHADGEKEPDDGAARRAHGVLISSPYLVPDRSVMEGHRRGAPWNCRSR
jgi:putative cardiolipin synthase